MLSFFGRFSRAAYEYTVLHFGLSLLAILCLAWSPFALVLDVALPRGVGGRVGRWAVMLGFRFYIGVLALTRGFRFDLKALDVLQGQPPVIIAPNHPSLLDAVMTLSRLCDVACILKAPLMNNVLFGAGARLAGYIPNASMTGMVLGAVEALTRGRHVLIFPEGTRTTRAPINPLMGSIVLIARRAGVPIQTVFIETDSGFLGKNWPLFRRPTMPITYRMRLGKQVLVADQSTPTVIKDLEDYFAGELATSPVAEPLR